MIVSTLPISLTVLSLDSSIENLGWAIFDARGRRVTSGTWHPSKAKTAPARECQLADFVLSTVRDLDVTDVVVEIPDGGERFFRTRDGARQKMTGKSERTYAISVGICLGAARSSGARVHQVRVQQWKGNGKKEDVNLLTARRFGLSMDERDSNELDAVGMGDWWIAVGSKLL